MAITGDYLLDFGGLPDDNPFTHPDLNIISGTFSLTSGDLEANSSQCFLNTTATPTNRDALAAKVTLDLDYPGGDPLGPALLDNSGNGYVLRCHFTETRIWSVVAGSLGSLIGDTVNGSPVAGDDLEITINETTGLITTYLNGVQQDQITDNTSTGLNAGIFISRENTGISGITMFAADGYAVAAASVDTVDDPIQPGVNAHTVSNFGSVVTGGRIYSGTSQISFSSANDTTATIPSIADAANAVLFGAVNYELTDGTDTAEIATTLAVPTGYGLVTLTDVSNTGTAYVFDSWAGTPEIGGQIIWDDSTNLTIESDGAISGVAGTYQAYYISPSEAQPTYEGFEIILGVAGDTVTIDQATAAPGDSITWTTSIVGVQQAYITDSFGNILYLTNVTDNGGTIPSMADGLQGCQFGSGLTITVSK